MKKKIITDLNEITKITNLIRERLKERHSRELDQDEENLIEQTLRGNTYDYMNVTRTEGAEFFDLIRNIFDSEIRLINRQRSRQRQREFKVDKIDFPEAIIEIKKHRIERSTPTPLPTPPSDDIYIKRSPIEKKACEANKKLRSLIRIKAPIKMGKTYLLNYILQDAEQEGYQTFVFDFDSLTNATINDYTKLLQNFCISVGKKILPDSHQIRELINRSWEQSQDDNVATTHFFEDYILEEISGNFVLALDSCDEVFERNNIRDDFCKLFRSWNNNTRTGSDNSEKWQNLHLIFAHSTHIYGSFDINSSPLGGVGEDFKLSMFNDEQIEQLIEGYKIHLDDRQKEELINLLGGYPFLLVTAIKTLKTETITFENFLIQAPTDYGIYRYHLQKLYDFINDNSELKEAYKQVVNSNEPVKLDGVVGSKLESLGLVIIIMENNKAKPSNNLYRIYFQNRLN